MFVKVVLACIAMMIGFSNAAIVAPYAAAYNAHVVNHAYAPYVASPYAYSAYSAPYVSAYSAPLAYPAAYTAAYSAPYVVAK